MYGGDFVAAIQRGMVHATQFHPEKSGAVGLKLLVRVFGLARPGYVPL